MSKRNNRNFRNLAPKSKPTLQEFLTAKLVEIRSIFIRPHAITIVARDRANPESEVVITDDDMDGRIAALIRRRDGVVATQAAANVSGPGAVE